MPLSRSRQRSLLCFAIALVAQADPQPYDHRDLDWFLHDVAQDLVGVEADFGISLGDLVGDDLDLFEPLNRVQGLIGIPWYNVSGNHDCNFFSPSDRWSLETYRRVYGPDTYAFQYGPVHCVVLDNVIYDGYKGLDAEGKPRFGGYAGGLREEQLDFIENLAAEIPAEERIVLLMHIPLMGGGAHQVPQRDRLMQILSGHPHTMSFSGHTHIQQHWFLGPEEGYAPGPGPNMKPGMHHHANVATAGGVPDAGAHAGLDPGRLAGRGRGQRLRRFRTVEGGDANTWR